MTIMVQTNDAGGFDILQLRPTKSTKIASFTNAPLQRRLLAATVMRMAAETMDEDINIVAVDLSVEIARLIREENARQVFATARARI